MKTIRLVLGCVCVTTLLACAPAGHQDGYEGRTQGIGKADRLTSAEWSAYTADQLYVHGLVRPDVPVHLNYADPRQYNFAISRLKLAGKTAENSPYLFELIEARRKQQVAQGLASGALAEVAVDQPTAARREMHFIEEAAVGNVLPRAKAAAAAGPTLAVGTASSTYPDGSVYTYVDVTVSTKTGRPIAPLTYKDEFENPAGNVGANVTISTSGDTAVSTIRRYVFESYKYEDRGDGVLLDSYVRTESGATNPQSLSAIPTLSAPLIQAPVDVVIDNHLSICMDRAWTNDCDYVLNGAAQSIQVPLKGSIAVTSAHVFDSAKIQQIIDALTNGQSPPEAGLLKLILTNVGGGCDVTDINTLYAKMLMFWNRVTLSADKKTFFWDLTGASAAFFDDGCRQVQDAAKLTARIPLPLLSVPGNESSSSSITISNDPDVLRPEGKLLPMSLTNSCLAEGTQIQLGDGKLMSVESLHIGQDVFNPYAREGNSLTITDTAKGNELAPMVRIRDEAGRTLLVTEMHPIATADRGMVQARALRTGDVVLTQHGASKLTDVHREPYSGKVYNLKVGSPSQLAGLGQDQTVVYANGFIVGDGQIQSKYESLAQRHGDKPAEPAAQWRRDRALSPR